VVFLGTSLTAGYGIGEDLAYPALIRQKIDSAGLRYRVVNAGVSGETSAGGLRRLEWLLKDPIAVLVLELGANDGLRGQDVDSMEANLRAIVARTRAAYPDARIVLAGMQAPPNLGLLYARRFAKAFPLVAQETGSALIPFLLEGVAAVDSLNQPDGKHPTAAGHAIIAETVWRVLEPELQNRRS
jgi:acyl-CoA thioesterase-1